MNQRQQQQQQQADVRRFPPLRRTKQELSLKETSSILEKALHGTLALAPRDEHDFPYAVPLSYAYQDNAIYFHCAIAGRKLDAIKSNARASFCVVTQDDIVPDLFATSYRSVIVFGDLHLVEDEAERLKAFRALGRKYSRGLNEQLAREIETAGPRALIYRLDICHMTGKQASEAVRKRADELHVSPAVHKSMQSNKRANTKPELLMRQHLRKAGLIGYRLQWNVPGHPDIAWPGKKVALFINGCFWHRCPHCKPAMPKKNIEYWTIKFENNQKRDKETIAQLKQMGWNVHVVWECQLKKKQIDETMAKLLPELANELGKPIA